MNFLAHLYLSYDIEPLMVGNMITDFLKGKQRKNIVLPLGVLQGINLHRKIDKFTDNHHIVELSKKRLRSKFSHFSPVISDIYYDHFLAKNWNQYSETDLHTYSFKANKILKEYKKLYPPRLKKLLNYNRFARLLISYAKISGIRRVFDMTAKRTKFKSNMEFATQELIENYEQYYNEFAEFWKELRIFAHDEIKKMEIII